MHVACEGAPHTCRHSGMRAPARRPGIQKFTKPYWIPGSRQERAPRNDRVLKTLQHREAGRLRPARKRLIERVDLSLTEREVARGGIFGHVGRARSIWNRKERWPPGEKAERHLPRARAMRLGDCLQHCARLAARRWKIIVAER